MKTLQITEANLRKVYKNATPEFKTMLEDIFGKKYFFKGVTDCDTYEELCDFIGEPPVDESKLKQVGFTQDEIDYRKLKQITKAYNEGWVADYNDENQRKWVPRFNFLPLGARFYGSYYDCSVSYAGHAALLCFKDEVRADLAGKKFTELYGRFING